MIKIIVSGLHGYIGTRLLSLGRDLGIIDLSRKSRRPVHPNIINSVKCDIADKNEVFRALSESESNTVVHLAGKTHIDRCEKDRLLGKKSESWKINATGTQNLAQACKELNKRLVYISTECVFDGKKGFYRETDKPDPVNWYGITKYAGEKKIMESGVNSTIIRSVLAYGAPLDSDFDPLRIFYKKLKSGKNLEFVCDQKISYTFIDDLVSAIILVIRKPVPGIFHFASPRAISPFDFARNITDCFFPSRPLKRVSLKNYFGKSSHYRLKNASLSSEKFKKEFGIQARSLSEVLPEIKSYFSSV